MLKSYLILSEHLWTCSLTLVNRSLTLSCPSVHESVHSRVSPFKSQSVLKTHFANTSILPSPPYPLPGPLPDPLSNHLPDPLPYPFPDLLPDPLPFQIPNHLSTLPYPPISTLPNIGGNWTSLIIITFNAGSLHSSYN